MWVRFSPTPKVLEGDSLLGTVVTPRYSDTGCNLPALHGQDPVDGPPAPKCPHSGFLPGLCGKMRNRVHNPSPGGEWPGDSQDPFLGALMDPWCGLSQRKCRMGQGGLWPAILGPRRPRAQGDSHTA